MISLNVFPYLEVSASEPKNCVIAMGVGSTLPCEIVISKAAKDLIENKIKNKRNLIMYKIPNL